MVDPRGFAPRSPLCGGGILLLDDGPWRSPGELNSALHGFNVTCDRYTRTAEVVDWMPRQESNLQLRRSERRLRTGTECSAMAVSTGVAPATSALTRRRLHGFGLETRCRSGRESERSITILPPLLSCWFSGWRAAEESHPAGWFWKPPWPSAAARIGLLTAFFGAPCGSRTRVTGLEDRRSAVELRTRE